MEFYHVLNRGVEKRDVVYDDGDRMRFVKGLYTFNDRNLAKNPVTQKKHRDDETKPRNILVYIHAWCLMDNHYHILLSPKDDDPANISLFMKKLSMGYAKFFNEKYQRSGHLWQGKYKKIHVARDQYFDYLPYYIHLNPLDYVVPEWRNGKVKEIEVAQKQLSKYRWSSYFDYNNKKNFPSLLYKNNMIEILGNQDNQQRKIKNIISGDALALKGELYE